MPRLTLLTAKGLMHDAAGLNWGFNPKNHTRPYDAYIPIHMATLVAHTGFFKPRIGRTNHVLTFTWDDGTVMLGRFEASMSNARDGLKYPKQISSYPNKDILGLYLRKRIGVVGPRKITVADLNQYGRTHVDITHVGPSSYYLDFHV